MAKAVAAASSPAEVGAALAAAGATLARAAAVVVCDREASTSWIATSGAHAERLKRLFEHRPSLAGSIIGITGACGRFQTAQLGARLRRERDAALALATAAGGREGGATGHAEQVATIARQIAERMGLPAPEIEIVELVAIADFRLYAARGRRPIGPRGAAVTAG